MAKGVGADLDFEGFDVVEFVEELAAVTAGYFGYDELSDFTFAVMPSIDDGGLFGMKSGREGSSSKFHIGTDVAFAGVRDGDGAYVKI